MVRDKKTTHHHKLEYDADETILTYQWQVMDLKSDCIKISFQLRETDRTALAKRFDVNAFEKIAGYFEISQPAPECWDILSCAEIEAVQNCVVSTHPVQSVFSFSEVEQFKALALHLRDESELSEDGFEMQLAEPVMDGTIPLGETLAQHISLHLPLQPRSEDADGFLSTNGQDDSFGPFHKLSVLKKKK